MPKFSRWEQFIREWRKLTPEQKKLFRAAWQAINTALMVSGRLPAPPLVQKITDYEVYEVRWAADGRATFHLEHDAQGQPIVVWRRIGGHAILKQP